jgi:hypothetical protein
MNLIFFVNMIYLLSIIKIKIFIIIPIGTYIIQNIFFVIKLKINLDANIQKFVNKKINKYKYFFFLLLF